MIYEMKTLRKKKKHLLSIRRMKNFLSRIKQKIIQIITTIAFIGMFDKKLKTLKSENLFLKNC